MKKFKLILQEGNGDKFIIECDADDYSHAFLKGTYWANLHFLKLVDVKNQRIL